MTAAERAFLNRLRSRANRLAPELARRELAAYDMIREVLTERELVRAIESGELDRLIWELLNDETLDGSFARLRDRIDTVLLESSRQEAKHLPSFLRPQVFGVLNPLVIEAAQALDTRVIQGLKAEVRETVRQVALDGLAHGTPPRTIARRIRESVGLAPNHERAVANFRAALERGDVSKALGYKLRDRRFDRSVRAGGLSQDQIDRMVSAYRRRFIAHNAETHARSIANDAQKRGQRLSWEDAIRRGVVAADDLVDTWIAVGGPHGDGRNRPEHLAMHGERVGFNERFSNGQLIPGESEYNCRCLRRTQLKANAMRSAA